MGLLSRPKACRKACQCLDSFCASPWLPQSALQKPGFAVCLHVPLAAGNMVGPSVYWSQQVMPALAAVPKLGVPGADAAGADAAPAPADVDEVAWDAQGTQTDQEPHAFTASTGAHTGVLSCLAPSARHVTVCFVHQQPHIQCTPMVGSTGRPFLCNASMKGPFANCDQACFVYVCACVFAGHGSSSEAPVIAAVGSPESLEPSDPDLVEALRRTNLYRKKHQVGENLNTFQAAARPGANQYQKHPRCKHAWTHRHQQTCNATRALQWPHVLTQCMLATSRAGHSAVMG